MDEQLLVRFLTHQSTPEEIKQIDRWISADKERAEWLFKMERIWSLRNELYYSDKRQLKKAYKRFVANRRPDPHGSTKKKLLSWSRYVAAISIIVLLVINIFKLQETREASSQMNIIEVPKGQRTTITLSDGTKVWLNAESKLTYPSNFSPKKRLVVLEGEGFFEVAQKKDSPFTVNVPQLNIMVLGTMFNVKAYHGEITEVILEKGKIEVVIHTDPARTILMEPNDQILYSKETGLTINRHTHASTVKKWIAGETYFWNQPLKNITKELERKFNIPINIRDKELESELFNCRTQPDATLIQIMNLLKETRRIDYLQNEKNIVVFNPKNQPPMK